MDLGENAMFWKLLKVTEVTCSRGDIAVSVPVSPQLEAPGKREVARDLNRTRVVPGVFQVTLRPAIYTFQQVLFLQFLESFMKRKCKDIFQSFQMTFLIDKAVQGRYLFLRPSITISLSNGHIFCSMTCPAMHIFQFYG